RVLDFSLNLLRGFGFEEFRFDLSVRDPNNLAKYAGEDEMWVQAEASLAKALEARDLPYKRMEGEAVFYGPKIDIHIKDALERTWQCTTIQFDFNLPSRFNMSYVGPDGREHRPYMVHRALLGSVERFYALLIEHYAGAFPVWLMPVQAVVIPIADRHNDYAQQVLAELQQAGIRAEVDLLADRMNAKIRKAQTQKIPYMLVIGDREMETKQINLRLRDGSKPGSMDVADLIVMIEQAVAEKSVL
ncbi:MAG: threonine--tRNA ligase, partial [Anaerolineae bacterium]|nr:threonine--tRNA ligase [Anaerolineae bacterium]